ncbi:MAG: hypothetical protein EBR67_09980 [Proteobacteria bacterium]|nr:hypothetical protein [Pseudomonadota bacterium]
MSATLTVIQDLQSIEDYSLYPEEQECIFWSKEYHIYQEGEIDIGCQRRQLNLYNFFRGLIRALYLFLPF